MEKRLSEKAEELISTALIYFYDAGDKEGAFNCIAEAVKYEAWLRSIEQRAFQDRTNVKKLGPRDYDYQKHEAQVEKLFTGVTHLSRLDLERRLSVLYGVGKNKLNQNGGFIHYLLGLGLLKKVASGYAKGQLKPELIKKIKPKLQEAPKDEAVQPGTVDYDFPIHPEWGRGIRATSALVFYRIGGDWFHNTIEGDKLLRAGLPDNLKSKVEIWENLA